ncbi:MAG: MDR family MFS transporter [Capsulimonadaceae bacterium]|nr:MDR family MFS transporter [Capsulimonadaceae bacterium]
MAMMMGAFMQSLDNTSVVPALPMMQGNLGASPDEINWVGTGYILSTVVVLPMSAWLSYRFGRKRYLLGSILLFTSACTLCGLSDSLETLVFWRIVEGACGAGLMSIGQSTILEVFPRKQSVLVQTIFSFGIMTAPTVGPAFGGWMVDNYSWQYIFLTKFPIGIIIAYLIGRYLHDSPRQNASSAIDWMGIGLLGVGLGSLQYVLEEGQRYDWFDDASITRISVIAAICLTAFIAWELRRGNTAPVVELRVLKDRGLAAGVLLTTLVGFAIYSTTYMFPMFVQNILRFTPTESGMSLVPGGVVMGFAVLVSGQLMRRGVDARYLILLGIPIFILSMWYMGHLSSLSGYDDAQIGLILRGLSLGFISTPITVAAFAGLRGRQIPAGAGLLNLCRQLGGSFGIALLSSYVQSMAVLHRTTLVSRLATTNQGLSARVSATCGALTMKGMNPSAAHAAALALVDRAVQRQAMTIAYNNAYLLVGVVFAVLIPSVFLFKRKPSF